VHDVLTGRWTLTSGYRNLASFSAHGFILKLRVTVISQCEGRDDMGGYLHPHIELETLTVYMYVHDGQVNEEMDSRITENLRAFRHSVPFLKDFWEPMSVDVKVILLVEGNTIGKYLHPYIESRTLRIHTCMYTMVTDSSTRR
jgi:hypothetical protein